MNPRLLTASDKFERLRRVLQVNPRKRRGIATLAAPVHSVTMRTMRSRMPTLNSQSRLTMLAPALILGIIGMHSLLMGSTGSPDPAAHDIAATMSMSSHEAQRMDGVPALIAAVDAAANTSDDDHGHDDGVMNGCGGLVAMCLALLVSAAGCWMARTRAANRVLWSRPPSARFTLGAIRDAFRPLTPLQRSTILRC